MFRHVAALPTELCSVLQNFRVVNPASALPISKRFQPVLAAYAYSRRYATSSQPSTTSDLTFLEGHDDLPATAVSEATEEQSHTSSIRRPPSKPPESFLEAPSTEYSQALSRLPEIKLAIHKTPNELLLELLERGQISAAIEMLEGFKRAGEAIRPDSAFTQFAIASLREGNYEAFLDLWSICPSPSFAKPADVAGTNWKGLTRNRFQEAEGLLISKTAGGSSRDDRTRYLTRFGLDSARKGALQWSTYTYKKVIELSTPQAFVAYWQQISDLTLERTVDAYANTQTLRSIWNKLVLTMAKSDVEEAVKWGLEVREPSRRGEPYIFSDTYAALDQMIEDSLTSARYSLVDLLHLQEQLQECRQIDYPQIQWQQRTTETHPPQAILADVDTSLGDRLGFAFVSSLTLSHAKEEIAKVVNSQDGLNLLAPTSLAGFIHLSRLERPNEDPFDVLDLDELSNVAKRISGDPLATIREKGRAIQATKLRLTALMWLDLHQQRPERVVARFRSDCLPTGAPESIYSKPVKQPLPEASRRVLPSRYMIALLLQALATEIKTGFDLEQLYSSFVKATFESRPPYQCILQSSQKPNGATFQVFIQAFCNQRDPDRALQILLEMQKYKIKKLTSNCNTILMAYIATRQVDKAMELLSVMEERQIGLASFDSFLESPDQTWPKPTVATYTAMIKGCALQREIELGKHLQKRMESYLDVDEMEWHYSHNRKLQTTLAFLNIREASKNRKGR